MLKLTEFRTFNHFIRSGNAKNKILLAGHFHSWMGQVLIVPKCDRFAASPMQNPSLTFGPFKAEFLIPASPIDEDC